MDYSEKTDQDLVRLSRRGDERAARELVHRFERPVFSLIYRMVRDRELAEDLSQDVFVRTFNNLDRYDRSYKFSSWLFKIAYNLTVDHLRRRELPTISVHGAPDAVTPDRQEATSVTLESDEEAPDDRLVAKELAGELEEAISALREDYRTAILLRHVEGRSYEEIAEIMEIPLGTVKTYIFRARRELREALSATHGDPDD
ncbi:MAG: sigma-70 family RNA polymerase sigma factor [marine benthic group bacterium]|nr:sigma-70 family RNA polymerase sigma factor [Gemmatimonadota bacterium]MCL7963521.1 sigma-70 family RNA polymerase sigma factor [Candidatus Carthagonibacter metallireducens]MCL7937236.1 sigma-70 family RNA polymerase sigma factor [Gemmatimonadota bacterium]MCL7958047.1 sigma-70 family RNA polymerase sigma factor [Gemmatimonadota bacterium]MCL7964319.1 sigma-70 family RNA polymerase sigma factor [Gemmatimonadota bacterium]